LIAEAGLTDVLRGYRDAWYMDDGQVICKPQLLFFICKLSILKQHCLELHVERAPM